MYKEEAKCNLIEQAKGKLFTGKYLRKLQYKTQRKRRNSKGQAWKQ